MKRMVNLLFFSAIIVMLTACGNSAVIEQQAATELEVQGAAEESETVQTMTDTEEQELEKESETVQSVVETEQQETEEESEISKNVTDTEQQEEDMDKKTLVVYFSCTGSTELVAEYAAEILGADIYEIVPEDPYTEEDLAYYTDCRADQEQADPNARPEISGGVENIDEYDTIILGYPIWHGQAPRIISTFLESYDFSEKTIVPFCTSHSSGIGSSASDLHALCSTSTEWRDGQRFEAGVSKESVQNWLEELGIE